MSEWYENIIELGILCHVDDDQIALIKGRKQGNHIFPYFNDATEYRSAYPLTSEEIWQLMPWQLIKDEESKPLVIKNLAAVKEAIKKYYLALDKRQHGGIAQDVALNEIQQILKMSYKQGEMLNEIAKQQCLETGF